MRVILIVVHHHYVVYQLQVQMHQIDYRYHVVWNRSKQQPYVSGIAQEEEKTKDNDDR